MSTTFFDSKCCDEHHRRLACYCVCVLVEDYLNSLPASVASYPEAKAKCANVRIYVEGYDKAVLAEVLPPEVADLLHNLPPDSYWVPEVSAQCIYLALRQCFFASDDTFLEFTLARAQVLTNNALYRVMFLAFSRRRISQLLPIAWNRFHRGSVVEVLSAGDNETTVRLRFPENLFSTVLIRAFNTSFVAALKITGAQTDSITLLDRTPTSAMTNFVWAERSTPKPQR